MVIGSWFLGFVGLLVATAVASSRGRAHPHDVAGRGVIAVAAVAYAGLVVAAVWGWGGSMARDGRADRLRDGATVAVTLDGVRILDPARPREGARRVASIGHGPDATLRVPGEGLAEVARAELDKRGVVTVRAFDELSGSAGAIGATGATRANGERHGRHARVIAVVGTEDPIARASRACVDASADARRAFELSLGTIVVAVECDGDRPIAGLAIRRDERGVLGMPLIVENRRLAGERRSLHAGDALRIGSAADAIPNLVTWEVTAPAGTSAMLAIPLDPADCDAWAADPTIARAVGQRCAITAGAFELTATALVPDAVAVVERATIAAIAIGGPALLLLLVVALSARHGRKARVFGRALRMCVLGAGLVALACWRLVWAHRIDAMHEAVSRVRDNELAAIAIGGALAGCAVLALDALEGRSLAKRVAAALLGWGAWLVGCFVITGIQPPLTYLGAGVLGLSAIAALTPVLGDLAGRVANRVPPEVTLLAIAGAALAARSVGARGALVKLGLAYATVLAGHAALRRLLTRRHAARGVAREDSRPGATVVDEIDAPDAAVSDATHEESGTAREVGDTNAAIAADLGIHDEQAGVRDDRMVGVEDSLPVARWRYGLRRAVQVPPTWARDVVRRALLLSSLAAAVGAIALLDTGVTLAIVGVGLALAMLVAGHDAMYDASHSGKLGLLEREHARLLVAHGVAAAGVAVGVATAAILATDRELLESGALVVMHAPLVAVGLFGIAAAIARSHRRAWAPWLAAALAALAVWGMRDAMLARATAGDGVASQRVAAVIEPGYALLRDDTSFVANATAWREAAVTTDTDTLRGQGYFGARIRDTGVMRSLENDYLPVLVARESGIGGLMQSVLLLLGLVVGGGAIASLRLPHASRAQRTRWLVTGVAGALVVYQPLAALGILPLTGITWPGLGIDSPGDLWLFVIGLVWCLLGAEQPAVTSRAASDERVRRVPRVARARRVVLGALVLVGLAAVVIVARAGAVALSRAGDDDERVTTALRYASSLACAAGDSSGASFDEAIPGVVAGKPADGATVRFEREVIGRWRAERAALLKALEPKPVEKTVEADIPSDDGAQSSRDTFDRSIRPAVHVPAATNDDLLIRVGKSERSKRATNRRPTTKRSGKARDDAKGATTVVRRSAAANGGRDRAKTGAKTGALIPVRAGVEDAATDAKSNEVLSRVLELFGLERPTPEPVPCPARAGSWRLARDGDACVATLSLGWPNVKLTLRRDDAGVQARCAVTLPDDAVSALRTRTRVTRERIRVVSAPIGASADDLGEVVLGSRIVRLRAGAPKLELSALAPGVHVAGELGIGDATLEVRASPMKGVVLRGKAELFVAEAEHGAAWRRAVHAGEVGLDRISLVSSGPAERRVVALVRPPRAWEGAAPVIDSLVGDTAGDRMRRLYPHGAALPELGWVNPYDLDRSLGLDGWIHAWAAQAKHDAAPACGTLAPPPVAVERVCSRSPLDGVLECRVALQPQLALSLRDLAGKILVRPKPFTGREVAPVRVAFVALRGDTGEILAQGNLAAGRPALAFAPTDARAEAELVKLRDRPGEADAERVDWNLPIAVGSTFKPIVARAAELAFPTQVANMSWTAAGHGAGCRARRGAIDPIVGHCPPTSLRSIAGMPTTSDVHEFLAKSPNWFQAALGLVGLGLNAKMTVRDQEVSLVDIAGSDLASWPSTSALTITDDHGLILNKRNVSIAGLRRTPLWSRVEALLGRPLCTLGDRASCQRAASRADVCAARALPIAAPGADLRNLVALGPDRIDLYASNRKGQTAVPVREYLQLLRGSGVHAIGSLAQITDAFGRVVFDANPTPKLAASWFPTPSIGAVPAWSCAHATGRENSVLGADGGLCGVVRPGGTGHAGLKELLADPNIVIYGAKTGTIDSLADIARNKTACARWNATHIAAARLACGKAPPDDSLFVIAFGVVTPRGTIPITLGIQLQRAGTSGATKAAPSFMRAIAAYLRG